MSFAGEVFGRLAGEDYLRGLSRAGFIDRLTVLLADVNALHPFREGNGRTQPAFLAQLARDAGYRIRWAAMDAEANVAASAAAHRGDNTLLRAMLEQLVELLKRQHRGTRSSAATSPPGAMTRSPPAPSPAVAGWTRARTSAQHLGPHPDTLSTRASLAYWRGVAGNPAGAAAALEQLLPDRLRVLGPDHPDTLTARHNLAYWRARARDSSA